MKLLHATLQFEKEENVKLVFEDLFSLKCKRNYTLDESLAEEIFGIKHTYKVKFYELENTDIEVFIGAKPVCTSLNHIALKLKYSEREEVIAKAKALGFRVFEKEREGKDKLVFVKDNEGNYYELKCDTPAK
jgi:hypothetical protein